MFGGLLKKSPFMRMVNWDDVMDVASQSADPNDISQQEFLSLLDKAKKIYAKEKKKKKTKPEAG